jgi:hypothetical protein
MIKHVIFLHNLMHKSIVARVIKKRYCGSEEGLTNRNFHQKEAHTNHVTWKGEGMWQTC